MKKIFTLFFAVTIFGAAAFAQERHQREGNRYNNSYQYPSRGIGNENNSWNHGEYDNFDRDHRFRESKWFRHRRFEHRDGDDIIFRDHGYYGNYPSDYRGHGKRFSLNIVIGKRDRY